MKSLWRMNAIAMSRRAILACLLIASLLGSLAALYPGGRALAAPYTWSTETVDSSGVVGWDTSLAFDSSNNPAISYYDTTNTDLKYAHWNGSSWDVETVDSAGDVGKYTSLAFDNSGNPGISYFDDTNDDLKYAHWNGTSWDVTTVSTAKVGWSTSLAFDSSGRPNISSLQWHTYLLYWDLMYYSWNGSSWVETTVESIGGGTASAYTSLAFDSSGNPGIAYYHTSNEDLKYAYFNGTSWNTETVDSNGSVGWGWRASLAFDSSGNPGISYHDDINNTLRYAHWNGSSWDTQMVDNASDVGQFTSLAFNSSSNPAISYYDNSNDDLKFASYSGTSWSTETVTSNGNVGMYGSLAFDSSGNIGISYYDESNGDLKYASADLTAPSAPILSSPANSSVTTNQKPTFDWSDVSDPSGVSYRIQIDDNSNFSSINRDESNITSSTWTMDWNLWDATWYWKVRAVDGAGNEGSWSSSWSFTVDTSRPPTPGTVSPSGSINNTTPTIDWDDVTDATGVTYSLQVDDDSNFSSPTLSKTGITSSEYTLTSPEALSEDTYYWRVRAVDGAGNEGYWSGYRDFTVDTTAPAPTTLSSPADSGLTNTRYPNLNWSYVYDPSGTTYKLQVDDDSDFSSTALDKSNLSNTNYTVTTPLDEKTYYWRVKVVDGAGNESAWSSEWSFTVDVTNPSAPTLVSPTDSTLTNNRQPIFDWSDVTDSSGVSYRIQIDNNSNFGSPERDESNIGDSTWTMDWNLSDNTYYWRVMAVDGAGNESAWTGAWSFDLDASTPPTPGMVSPSGNINDTTPTVNWDDVTDASGVTYSLQVDDDWQFSSPEVSKTGLTTSEYTLTSGEALTEGNWYWRVKAIDGASNESGWSGYWSFTVDITPPAPTSLSSPADGGFTNTKYPNLNWSYISDPSGVNYKLQIDDNSDFSSPELDKSNLSGTGYTVPTPLDEKTYYWRVKAVDGADNESAWSSEWSFTVDVTKPSAPTLASPNDGDLTNDQRPTFDWSDVTDPSGVSYRIQIDNGASFYSNERDEGGIADSTWPSDWSMWDDTWYWRVKAVDGAGNESDWSSAWSFILDASSPSQPNLITPNDWMATNNITPSFDWSDVTDPSGVTYGIQLDNDPYFSSPVLLTQQGLTSSDYTLSTSEALAEGTYYWRVNAIDGAGNDSGWSYSWALTIDTTAPAAPNLSRPSDGTAENNAYPSFEWSDVTDPSGVNYNLEIATDSAFTNIVLTKQGLNNRDYGLSSGEALTDGTYYWRVQTIDNAGNGSNWSSTWSFIVDTTPPSAPTLVSPNDGDLTNNQRPDFDWDDVTDPSGVSYRIQIDNDINFLSIERDQDQISNSTWTMDWNLWDDIYYWRIKTVDGAGNESTWSSAWSLNIDASSPSQPNLMTPNDWMATNNTTPSFDWSDVTDPSGVTYGIQVDDDPSFSSPVLLTQQGLTRSDYALSANEALAEGTYYWQVNAIDGAGNDSGWSYSWTLVIDTSAPPAPNLAQPSDDTTENNTYLHFEWSDVTDPSGVNYNLEIATDSTFTNIVLTKQGLNNRDYDLSPGDALADGSYFWRVMAVDEPGNSGNWSTTWSFTVDTTPPPMPNLTSPSDGITTNDPSSLSFEWSDVSDPSGVSYNLQIAWDRNFFNIEHNEGGIGDSPYTTGRGFSDGTYYWRVQAVDGANNEGNWSNSWAFNVEKQGLPDTNGSFPPPGSDGAGEGPSIPIIGGGVLVLSGILLGIVILRKSRRSAALKREFQSKLERWESKGYDVSELKDKLSKGR